MVQANMYFDESYTGEPATRNYTQGKLSTLLISGVSYCVTFYVTLCQISQYANDHIGAYLDNGSIDAGQDSAGCAQPQTSFTPQVVGSTIINDTLNWVKIQGSFIASGTEKFITIGNFFDAAHTNTVSRHPSTANNFSFYLIDDVSVIESNAVADAGGDMVAGVGLVHHIGTHEEGMPCTWYALGDTTPIGYGGGIDITPAATGVYHYVVKLDLCGHVTYDTMKLTVWPASIGSPQFAVNSPKVYPNPALKSLTIENAANCDVVFYDVTGRAILHSAVTTNKALLDIGSLPSGFYLVQIVDKISGEKAIRRILKE
jgi:hypothetical protein